MAVKKAEVVAREMQEIEKYDRNAVSFSDLVGQADEVQGNALVKDETLEKLEGVPFLITHVTFRRSYPARTTEGLWLAYVSCEGVVADKEFLDGFGMDLHGKPFRPGEHIVFNDGSTGVYRQIVQYLEAKGYVTLPEGPSEGQKEKCRFDAPPSEWPDVNYGTVKFDEAGFCSYDAEIRLLCPRGLRTSDYSNDFTEDGTTHYIA